MTYTIHKQGVFTINFSDDSRCGMGVRKFSYEFSVSSENLDGDGFVIEHFQVAERLLNAWRHGEWSGSCENLAATVGKIIVLNLPPVFRRQDVTIRIRLQGADKKSGASVEVTGTAQQFVNAEGIKTVS